MEMVEIRHERPEHADSIAAVIDEAFSLKQNSSHTEQFIVAGLRRENALTVSLIAIDEATASVIGHVAISPVIIKAHGTVNESASFPTNRVYGLGPVAVVPGHQNHGIGSNLVKAALDELCKVDPSRNQLELGIPGIPQECFLYLGLDGAASVPEGVVQYHNAFDARE
ncbi:hypothetical protein HDU98_000075 [Podochytrium sp. JEL0797]|nr:hypothetical protein HDU98_000075 [Podochytrium sp. JEL0797]